MDEAVPTVERPDVITWYKAYCILMALLYLAVAGFGLVMMVLGVVAPEAVDTSAFELILMGVIYAILGIALFVPFVTAVFLPPRPWVWVYGMVMICIGMTSCCCLPACIPLLIFWIKPDAKNFFGRT